MARTKTQKIRQVEGGIKEIGGGKMLILADFTGTEVNDLNSLRRLLADKETKFKVFKKRLLKIIFEKIGVDVDPKKFDGQVGVVISPKGVEEIASDVFRFSKQFKTFRILGGFDISGGRVMSAEEVGMIGQLPPREILLAQVVGMIAAPIRAFLYILSEKSKQTK